MKVVDWLARTTMLILAALATLALIGSLASVSNSPIGDAFPGQIEVPVTAPQPDTAASDPRPSGPSIVEPGQGTMTIETTVAAPAPTPPPDREIARWLKALTYAVLALAVFAAAGVIALLRIAGHLRRIAER